MFCNNPRRAEGASISKHSILSGGVLSRSEKRGRREFLREVGSSPVGEDPLGLTSKICVLGLEARPLAAWGQLDNVSRQVGK